ncbi:acyltransferase [Synechococcus sp. BIOS-E4-1]|nr:acyltransferase [Synechococcus sp. BIOS-E4-1]
MGVQQTRSGKRVLFFDQIKALMIALVIAIHVLSTFVFSFMGVHFPLSESPHPVFGGIAIWLLLFCNTFFMYMLFLLSGYFVPASVHKKGVMRYIKDRMLRIGIPFMAGLLLINNASVLIARLSPTSPLAELSWNEIPFNRVGVLWFLIVLFVFDLLYCAWRALRGDHFSIDTSIPTPQLRSWLISAVVLAIIEAMMTTRTDLWAALTRSPLDGLGAQGMHVFTYAFLFLLGCKASNHRWLERLDSHLVIRWFRFSIVLALSLLAICLVLTFNGSMSDEFGRLYLLTAFLNPLIGWGVIAYLLLWFQRNEKSCGNWLAAAGVDSFGAYIVHPIVLVVLLKTISLFSLNPWLIALSAIPLGIIISFGLTHQLRRIPTIAKII